MISVTVNWNNYSQYDELTFANICADVDIFAESYQNHINCNIHPLKWICLWIWYDSDVICGHDFFVVCFCTYGFDVEF